MGQNEPEREIFYLVERQVDVTVHYKARKLTFLLTKSPMESYSVFIREPYNVRKKFLRITRGGGARGLSWLSKSGVINNIIW